MVGMLTMTHPRRQEGVTPEPVARKINLFVKPGPSWTVGHVERELPPGACPPISRPGAAAHAPSSCGRTSTAGRGSPPW